MMAVYNSERLTQREIVWILSGHHLNIIGGDMYDLQCLLLYPSEQRNNFLQWYQEISAVRECHCVNPDCACCPRDDDQIILDLTYGYIIVTAQWGRIWEACELSTDTSAEGETKQEAIFTLWSKLKSCFH